MRFSFQDPENRLDYFCLALSLSMYGINRFIVKDIVQIPFLRYILRCHFNDYLAGICIISYVNIIFSYSKYSNIRIIHIVPAIVVGATCGILWEYVFPIIYPRGTSDFFDVVAYMMGAGSYSIIRSITKGQLTIHEKKD